MIRLATWTPAATPAKRARSCLVVLDGLRMQTLRPICVSDHPVTQAQEIWRHAATRTRVLQFRSQLGLCQTTQLAMRALLDWH